MVSGRPAVLIAWIECESCGRIDKPAQEFNYPEDMAADTQLVLMAAARALWALGEVAFQNGK